MNKQLGQLKPPDDTAHTKLQLDTWFQHIASLGGAVPFAVHQRGGATATVDVSSCVPVVNDIYQRETD